MGCEGSATAEATQKDVSTEKGPLASPDLQAFLQRASFDSLDVCQLASSPQPLFSPNGSGLELDDGENYLFSELFPGSLLFPSPTSETSADAEAIPVSAARLPEKILDACPVPYPSGVLATKPSVPTISVSTLNAPVPVKNIPASASEHVTANLEPQPKRRRTSVLQEPFEHRAFEEADYGSDMSLSYDNSLMENTDFDNKLETKRARNRDAARRMRQRQRQTITKLEVDMGNQYNTINGLLAKLGNLADEIKCTTQENDLLRQLLSSTQCPDIPVSLYNLQCLDEVKGVEDDICSPSLIPSVSLARNLPREEYMLLEKGACPASCTPLSLRPKAPVSPALVAAPAPSPVARPPRAPSASLPPSPFESPKKAACSPSKPHTPQRPALRSPFAVAHHRPSRFCSAAGGAGVPDGMVQPNSPGSKAALLENLSSGGASLQQEVLLALLRKLQFEQEFQLGGAAEDAVTEEEAVQIAAMALLESQGNISGAVGQMLAWGGLLQDS